MSEDSHVKPTLWMVLLLLVARLSLSADDPTPKDGSFLQAAIDQAYAQHAPRYVIPPDTYRLTAPPTGKAHLQFTGLQNFEIVATGVTFLLGTRNKGGIDFEKCQNVTFQGATLIHDPLPFSQGTITALAPDGLTVDVQIATGYPTDIEDKSFFPEIGLSVYDAATRVYLDATWLPHPIVKLSPQSFRCVSGRKLSATTGWKVGAAVFWRGATVPDVNLFDCARMKMLDLTVMNTSGFGFKESGGAGGNYYHDIHVTYGPKPAGATERTLSSSNADGFNSTFTRHGPTVEDFSLEGMNDDGVAIHGRYALVWQAQGADVTLGVRLGAPYCAPGDHLRFYDRTGSFVAESMVQAVATAPVIPGLAAPPDLRYYQPPNKIENIQVTLKQPVPAAFGWEVANADAVGSGFVLRRGTVRNNRARGMIIKASDGLIEDCLIDASRKAGIAIHPELPRWNEADYGRNIVIRHNTIRGIALRPNPDNFEAGAITIAAERDGKYAPLPGGFRNIVVENNTFENCDGPNLVVTSAQGVTLRDNHFVHPMWTDPDPASVLPGVDIHALIWLTQCSGLQLSGITVTQPGPFLQHRIVAVAPVNGTGVQ